MLWEATGEKPIIIEIIMRRWRWIGHTLRKGDECTEKQAPDWDAQGARRRGRLKKSWKRTVLD
jgi:hypothetical protein